MANIAGSSSVTNPYCDEQGRVARWYSTGTDIEDLRRAEDRTRNENVALREEVDKASMFEEIVGTSSALQAVLTRVAKVAPTESTIIISGETGTGKELIARAIHKRSLRSSRPFVSVNCAAIPQSLIASELFGHEKGAFTGASQRRLGRFEMAEGGTLFLDEVGELPCETQIALLRVLQERQFERVGGNQPIRADVRVISATNRDLKADIGNWRLSQRPVLSLERFSHRHSSSPGKEGRYPDPGRVLHRPLRDRSREENTVCQQKDHGAASVLSMARQRPRAAECNRALCDPL